MVLSYQFDLIIIFQLVLLAACYSQLLLFQVASLHDLFFYFSFCDELNKPNMGLINKVDMVCLSPVGYGV